MCTAISFKTKDFYFGRTLDYDISYHEEVAITPRNMPLSFRHSKKIAHHYAMIGMAYVNGGYPLYHEAVNEKGLGMAGLNFAGNAAFYEMEEEKDNIAQFEMIPWILAQCDSVKEAKALLAHTNLVNTPFHETLPTAELHWIIADPKECVVLECVKEGMMIYDNPIGVLTNNPPFPQQMLRLNDYIQLSPKEPLNRFSDRLPHNLYSRGMGAIGLPGDLSSPSRFVRAAFVKLNSVCEDSETRSVSQFFHILNAVDQQRGCCELAEDVYEVTIYTSCCNASKGIYYYTAYDNHQIQAVDMHKEDLEGSEVIRFALRLEESIHFQN